MIQLKCYNNVAKTEQFWIDLYETEPIKLTLSIEDITNADATSTYSKTFKVPGTRNNAEFFKNSFAVNDTLFDVTIKKPAEILVDGAEFKQGQIRLQKVFLNVDLDRYDYELIFLGETRDFSSKVGDRGLCELQLPELVGGATPGSTILAADVVQSWNAYPQSPSLTAGLHNGDIIYPLIDHGNTYDENGVALEARISTVGPNRFTQAGHPLTVDRFKPMIRAKRIWDQIFADAGYTYTSEFINSPLFHQIYISAFGNEATIGWDNGPSSPTSNNVMYAEGDNTNTAAIGPIFLPSAINDPGINFNTGIFSFPGSDYNGQPYSYYTVPVSGTYRIRGECYYVGFNNSSNYVPTAVFRTLTLYSFPPGGGAPFIIASSTAGHNQTLQFDVTLTTGVTPNFDIGDQLVLVLGSILDNNIDTLSTADFVLQVVEAPGDFNPASSLECVYKQMDFIKDMLTAFRLVLSPDPNNIQNFIVEPWQEYINSGQLYDWSSKLVQDKDFVIEPLFYDQPAEIDFKFQIGGDFANIYHQHAYSEPYGYLEFNANNDLLIGKREVKLNGIAPSILLNLEGTTPADEFNIIQTHTRSSVEGETQFLPIKPKTRFMFYNGLQPVNTHVWYFTDAIPTARTTYPQVSPYQQWPIAPQTLNLNWANDIQYWGTAPGLNENGSTLYSEYWSRYLSFLYGKFSRRVTAYFVLNNIDLNTFSFDDTIFVNGNYYRPEKIIDVEIGAYTQVKVQLLTANDYKPNVIPFQTLLDCTAVGVAGACAESPGSINVTTNGTPGFTWQLSNGQSGAALAGAPVGEAPYSFTIPLISVGTYTLNLQDSLGRTKQLIVTIPASTTPELTGSVLSITNASDCETCDGAVTTTSSDPSAICTWNDAFVGPDRTGLCAGIYSFTYSTDAGCTSPTYPVEIGCGDPCPTCTSYTILNLEPTSISVGTVDCGTEEIVITAIAANGTLTICSCTFPEAIPPSAQIEILGEEPCDIPEPEEEPELVLQMSSPAKRNIFNFGGAPLVFTNTDINLTGLSQTPGSFINDLNLQPGTYKFVLSGTIESLNGITYSLEPKGYMDGNYATVIATANIINEKIWNIGSPTSYTNFEIADNYIWTVGEAGLTQIRAMGAVVGSGAPTNSFSYENLILKVYKLA